MMRTKATILGAGLMMVLANALMAQSITGTVSDIDGEALPGAYLVMTQDWSSEQAVVATRMDGSYDFDLSTGNFSCCEELHLKCSFVGLRSSLSTVAFPQTGASVSMDFRLEPEAQSLGLVVVSAGRFEQRAEKVTVSIDVLPPSLVESRGTTSLETALEQNPGVSIVDGEPQIRSGSGFSYGAGSRVMVMVDDLPVLSGDAGRPTWGFLPLENLEQIEIIKGAASVLYGSAALSGVINVRTRFPDARPLTRATIQHGVYSAPKTIDARNWSGMSQQSNIRFLHSQRLGGWDVVIGGNIFGDDGYMAPKDSVARANTQYRPWKVDRFGGTSQARMNMNLRRRTSRIAGLGYGVNTNWQIGESQNTMIWAHAPDSLYDSYEGAVTRTNQLVGTVDPFVTYFSPLGIQHSLRTRWQYLNNENDNDQSNGSNFIYSEYQIQLNPDSWNWTRLLGWRLTGGIVGLWLNSNAELYSGGSSDGKNLARNRAVYLQSDFPVNEFLNISAGMRYESFTVNEYAAGKPVFRAGLNYQVAEASFLRASFGQGFRFPTIAESYIRTGLGSLQVYPNESLRPETSNSMEIGFKQGIKAGSVLGFIDLAFFRQTYENYIEFTFGQWGDPLTEELYGLGFKSINTGSSEVTGVEFSTMGKVETPRGLNVSFLAGYTYTNPISTSPEYNYNPDSTGVETTYLSTSHDTTGYRLKYRSPHLVRGDVQLEAGPWSGGISVRYQTALQNFDEAFLEFERLGAVDWGLAEWLYPDGVDEEGNYNEPIKRLPWLLDLRLGYKWGDHHKIGVIVSNLGNSEYAIRPLAIEAPRLTSITYTYEVH